MKIILALSALVFACACSHKVDTAGAPSFGASLERMQSAQAAPVPTSEEPPEGSGAQSALAQERYETGHTRPLLPTTTSTANPSAN